MDRKENVRTPIEGSNQDGQKSGSDEGNHCGHSSDQNVRVGKAFRQANRTREKVRGLRDCSDARGKIVEIATYLCQLYCNNVYMYKFDSRFRTEMLQIRGSIYFQAISSTFVIIQPRFQLFVSILAYVLLGNVVSVKKVKTKNYNTGSLQRQRAKGTVFEIVLQDFRDLQKKKKIFTA